MTRAGLDYSRLTPKQRTRRFRHYREVLGLTQDELALELGYGKNSLQRGAVVSHKENGVRDVTARDLLALECLLRRAQRWKRAQTGE